MEKQKADRIITEFLHKIYGFSVKKCFFYEEAEELSSAIIEAVYSSLLAAREIANIEGYIWRISENAYAKFVAAKKKHDNLPIEDAVIPFYDEFSFDDESMEELRRLRREIAFLTEKRRRIVYLFYYENKPISFIAKETELPEGTVKWHLNKARNELKEGLVMERKTGKLGIAPVTAIGWAHDGNAAYGGAPEDFLKDKLELNIVYSVYHSPKTKEEIAEDLGITPVFIEDKIDRFEKNGYLVKTKGDRYTTYVKFTPETYSKEKQENITKIQLQIAEVLTKQYVPKVREAIRDTNSVYIPSGNRELLEAAAVFYGIANKCHINANRDLSKYYIEPADGERYIAYVQLFPECTDPDYKSKLLDVDYSSCGNMNRWSYKYPSVYSWSIDSRFSSRKGYYNNNPTSDYNYIYEYICGDLPDNAANAEKINRLKEREFLTDDGKVNIMIVKMPHEDFFDRIPCLDEEIKAKFADKILESAANEAKKYPPQMQDLVMRNEIEYFIGNVVAMMTMDILYNNGTFKPLTEQERVTSNLLMFCDRLPE